MANWWYEMLPSCVTPWWSLDLDLRVDNIGQADQKIELKTLPHSWRLFDLTLRSNQRGECWEQHMMIIIWIVLLLFVFYFVSLFFIWGFAVFNVYVPFIKLSLLFLQTSSKSHSCKLIQCTLSKFWTEQEKGKLKGSWSLILIEEGH